jgi:hypothetical protein
MAERMRGKLNEQLSSAGVSEEARAALLVDLSAEFEGQISSGSMQDLKEMKETVSGIFEKHGLNVKDFMLKGPRVMGGMGGPGRMAVSVASGGASGNQYELLQSLLDSPRAENEDGANTSANAFEYSNAILDYLFGIDKEA